MTKKRGNIFGCAAAAFLILIAFAVCYFYYIKPELYVSGLRERITENRIDTLREARALYSSSTKDADLFFDSKNLTQIPPLNPNAIGRDRDMGHLILSLDGAKTRTLLYIICEGPDKFTWSSPSITLKLAPRFYLVHFH